MKTYLLVSGTIFVLLAALTFFIIVAHWGGSDSTPWFVLLHATMGIGSAALAVWAFRLARRLATTAA
jgi:hypothetical protein